MHSVNLSLFLFMNLTEKYRPQCREDFVGDKGIIDQLKECIKDNIPVLLTGPTGCGKTSAVYIAASELGYNVVEQDNNYSEIVSCSRMRSFIPLVYLIDNYEPENSLVDTIKSSECPIIAIVDEHKDVSQKLSRICKLIKMEKPSLRDIITRIKQIAEFEKAEVSLSNVTNDIRESINCTFTKSSKYKHSLNNFEKVENVFKIGKIEDIPIIWLLDNVQNFYSGKDVYDVVHILRQIASTGDLNLLSCLPRSTGGKAKYPFYLRKQRKHGFN